MINFGGGKSKGTQTIALPARTAEEQELLQIQLQAAREAAAYPTSAEGQLEQKLKTKGMENLLARLEGRAPVLSPEEQTLLNNIFDTAQKRGEADIKKFGGEIAAQRGMTLADSPIFSEVGRQQRELVEGLGAQKSASALDLGQAAAAFNERIAQFSNQLKQQAFLNRMNLAGLGQNLFQERLAGAPITRTGSNWSWGAGLNLGAAAGGLASGGWGAAATGAGTGFGRG